MRDRVVSRSCHRVAAASDYLPQVNAGLETCTRFAKTAAATLLQSGTATGTQGGQISCIVGPRGGIQYLDHAAPTFRIQQQRDLHSPWLHSGLVARRDHLRLIGKFRYAASPAHGALVVERRTRGRSESTGSSF